MATLKFKSVSPGTLSGYECLRQVGPNIEEGVIRKYDSIAYQSPAPTNAIRVGKSGLLETIALAYSYHVPLVLRPDDIWAAIILSFGRYVQTHAEQMRPLFVGPQSGPVQPDGVEHQGRKELAVNATELGHFPENEADWTFLMRRITETIHGATNSDITRWMEPTFTTTRDVDRIIAQLAIMSAVREYYSICCTLCGLSQVTLEGTLDDWKLLRDKAARIGTFGLNSPELNELANWSLLLQQVLQEFVTAYECAMTSSTIPNEDFWQRICTKSPRGSGSEWFFKGWCAVFSPFDPKGKSLLRPFAEVQCDHIYANCSNEYFAPCSLDVTITTTFGGNDCQFVTLYAGIVGATYANGVLAPYSQWSAIRKGNITSRELFDHVSHTYQHYRSTFKWFDARADDTDLANLLGFSVKIADYFNMRDQLFPIADAILYMYRGYVQRSETLTKEKLLHNLANPNCEDFTDGNKFAALISLAKIPAFLATIDPS